MLINKMRMITIAKSYIQFMLELNWILIKYSGIWDFRNYFIQKILKFNTIT